MEARAVAATRPGPEPPDSPAGCLVGRDSALAAVRALLDRAASGHGGSLLLHGDPGSGRSALLARAGAEAGGWTVLTAAGVDAERKLPLASLHRLLHPVRHDAARLAPAAWARLAGTLGRGAREVPPAGPDLLAVLRALATERPVLCRLDDAGRLDRAGLAALAHAARRCGEDRVAVLLAGPDPMEPAGRRLSDVRDLPRLRLEPLGPLEAQLLLRRVGVPRDLVAALAELGCGNPQALLDLAAALPAGPGTGRPGALGTLPPGSRSWHTHHALLEPLSGEARRLLLFAAADDRLTEDELARAAAGAGLDLAALRPAERAGLVQVLPDGVRLRPALLRTVAYHAAPVADRRAVHAMLARSLAPARDGLRVLLHQALSVAGPQPRLAARLAAAADEESASSLRAAHALERAALLAAESAAAEDYGLRAAQWYWRAGRPHRARQLLSDLLSERTDGDALPPVRAAARLLRSDIELSVGSSADAFEQLRATARDVSHGDRQVALAGLLTIGNAVHRLGHEDLLPDVARRAAALRHPAEAPEEELAFEQLAGMAAVYQQDLDAGVVALRRVLDLATGSHRTPDLLRASFAALLLGDDASAHRMALRAGTIAQARGEVTVLPQAAWLAALADFAMGRYAEARRALLAARPVALAAGLDNLVPEQTAMLAVLAAVGGDRAGALAHLEGQDHPAGRDDGPAPILAGWARSVVDLIDGDAERAFRRLSELAGPDAPPGHQLAKTALFCHWVEAAARAGRADRVTDLLPRFTEWTDRTGNPAWLALSARAAALVSTDDDEAEAAFERAHRLHVLAGTDLERARTDLLHGQRLRRHRRPGAARRVLGQALETFERTGATGWAEHARVELRAAGERTAARPGRPAGTGVGGLTAQQCRIAGLAAAGATNAEIAARLFISVRTVDYHLSKVFVRLGIRSRVELAGFDLGG